MNKNSAAPKAILECEGFTWTLSFTQHKNKRFRGKMYLRQKNAVNDSVQITISDDDLVRFIKYLTDHIGSEMTVASCPFLTYDMDFRIQALEGEKGDSEKTDGSYTIQIMLIKRPADNAANIYTGIEGQVYISKTMIFINQLRDMMCLNRIKE